MTYLIDTHVLIWYATGNPQLNPLFVREIQNTDNIIILSKASLWEIAVKVSLGKLSIGIPFSELEEYLVEKKIDTLEFDFQDLQKLIELPFYHRDPFDRLIISQAINKNLTLITDDNKFQLYPVQLLNSQ